MDFIYVFVLELHWFIRCIK